MLKIQGNATMNAFRKARQYKQPAFGRLSRDFGRRAAIPFAFSTPNVGSGTRSVSGTIAGLLKLPTARFRIQNSGFTIRRMAGGPGREMKN